MRVGQVCSGCKKGESGRQLRPHILQLIRSLCGCKGGSSRTVEAQGGYVHDRGDSAMVCCEDEDRRKRCGSLESKAHPKP